MAHSRYLYPEDVIVEVANGIRIARLNVNAPVVWGEAAKIASKKVDYLTGWEMARRAYEAKNHEEWYARVYPLHHAENLRFRAHLQKGLSVCSFHEKDSKNDKSHQPSLSSRSD